MYYKSYQEFESKEELVNMSDYPKGSWARWRPFLEISVINLSRCLPMEWAMHRCNTQQPCWWVAMSTQNFAAASKINCNTQWQVIKKIKTGFKYLLANYWRACRYILIKNICPDKIYTDLINCLKQKLFPTFLREWYMLLSYIFWEHKFFGQV